MKRIQYDARSGRLYAVERVEGPDGWGNELEELKSPMTFFVDFGTTEVGYMKFEGGVDFVMVPNGQPLPESPGEKYRQGFRVRLFHPDLGVRSFNSTARSVISSVNAMHTEWEDAGGGTQWAEVEWTGVKPITSGSGARKSTNYLPEFRFKGLVDSPVDPEDDCPF